MKQITEDYVSFEVAKLLQENGFDERCYKKYNSNGDLFDSTEFTYGPKAPTIQMVMKWLREVHNIIIDIAPNLDGDMNIYPGFCGIIYEDGSLVTGLSAEEYTYEQAAEVAIKYCLENLI